MLSRECFEQWLNKKGWGTTRSRNGNYSLSCSQASWQAWEHQQKRIDELGAKLAIAVDALEFYADGNEWSGHPWKLLFNSRHVDDDGCAVATKALNKIKGE